MQIKWSKKSQADLHDIVSYTKTQISEYKVENIIITILKMVEKIASFPSLGKLGLKESTREFFIPKTPFIIIYQVKDEELNILRIFHTKRFRIF